MAKAAPMEAPRIPNRKTKANPQYTRNAGKPWSAQDEKDHGLHQAEHADARHRPEVRTA